jgi:hypothetical protein
VQAAPKKRAPALDALEEEINFRGLTALPKSAVSGFGPGYITFFPTDMPMMKKIRHMTKKRKKRNLAMPAAAEAIPVKPNNAAISAITRKIAAHFNILIIS